MKLGNLTTIAIYAFVLLGFAPTTMAATPSLNFSLNAPAGLNTQALNVPWGQSSISLSQLQNLVGSNPGFGRYNIQFPNGLNWGLAPSQIQSMVSSYQQQARALGFNMQQGRLPDLSFSSLGGSSLANTAMIPINAMTSSMDQTIEQTLRDLRYREMNLSDSLPDWLRGAILWTWNQIVWASSYLWDKFVALFK
jgi:hypothetical protein